MKLPRSKFWGTVGLSFVTLIIILTVSAVWFNRQLTSDDLNVIAHLLRQFIGPLLIITLLLLAVLIWAVEAIFRNYIRPIHKMAEKVSLINTTNPSYRLPNEGAAEIRRLCERINEAAQRHEVLAKNVDAKIQLAKSEFEKEKNTLAAIVAELPEGVLICNADGRILLYNNRAKQLLAGASKSAPTHPGSHESKPYVGLGRSIFGIIDKNLLTHVQDQISEKLESEDPQATSYFVVTTADDRLLRAEAVPVLNQSKQLSGLVLIFYDITRQLASDSGLNLALEAVARGFRASLAGIRSAIETIIAYPQMDIDQLGKFRKIIHRESLRMGELLESNLSFDGKIGLNQWPLTTMSAESLTELLKTKALEKLQVRIRVEASRDPIWVKIESYSFLLVMLFLIDKVKNLIGIDDLACRLTELDWYVGLDLLWPGSPIKIEMLREWEQAPLVFEQEGLSLTLREIVDHLGSDIGSYGSKRLKGSSYLRLFLPVAETFEPEEIRPLAILPESRPEYYDFDLFDRADHAAELENRLLTELTYTVFDMETTGLNPSEGDEILSIAAIRIVNCRLLREERFEQLVDPLRDIPWESVQIHGIHPELLIGQPTIDKVLPRFQQFIENTILVAHNAAFDMRFLQMKEEQTAVKVINPVLDTLLLSAVAHPSHSNHDLEAIAQRLGVRILGRHTAMGDALVTGELFLKLLSLLAANGIYTLKDALEASKKTYYARIKF
ncbi:MAG: exonuclease domain-containing protein [Desulfobacteraceae bacterium]|jgi:DNA polymerase-3 subunit epsilon|nr:exonuclease domain-containing protein [Desulfobacteraceae bacterium]